MTLCECWNPGGACIGFGVCTDCGGVRAIRAVLAELDSEPPLTCDTCTEAPTCEFAGDAYNVDGDCLREK
jgi:hypothetical protein